MLLFVTPLLHETIDYLPGVDLFCVAKGTFSATEESIL